MSECTRSSAHPLILSSAHLLIGSSALLACANVQPPPGGPPDARGPELVAAIPESLAILPGFDDDVEFQFSEVVAEGSQPSQGLGTSDLERLVILSPTDRVPEVRWRRRRITVRPAEGWKPDRVYRVELLPGVTDVRRNRADVRRVVTFTTGAALPEDSLSGVVIDWKAGRPSAAALVEAVLQPDSLVYRAIADSSGNFRMGPLPHGEYVVYGVLDANRNLRRDPREAFDSTRVPADSTRAADLYAFVHDTLPPRIQSVAPTDSVTATITFALALDPAQRLDSTAVTLRKLPDSVAVGVRALRIPAPETERPKSPERRPGAPADSAPAAQLPDSLAAPADTVPRDTTPADTAAADTAAADTAAADTAAADTAAADTAAADTAAADTATAEPGRRPAGQPPQRPALNERLTLEAVEPWKPGDRFVVEIRGVRTVSGVEGDVRAPLVIPEAGRTGAGQATDSAAVRDSVPAAKDSLPARAPPEPPDR